MSSYYTTQPSGEVETTEYRIYFSLFKFWSDKLNFFLEKGKDFVSPFHDVPLWSNEKSSIINMVVEIPRGQQAKMEISKEDAMNPIKQDVKVWIFHWFLIFLTLSRMENFVSLL